jgi:hypothetical protein
MWQSHALGYEAVVSTPEEVIAALQTRVSRLENIAWVLGAVAVFLGVAGGSLWGNVRSADTRIATSLGEAGDTIAAVAAREREAILALRSADPGWGVAYCTHQQSRIWHRWVVNGAVSGETGSALRLEGMRIMLYRLNESPPTGLCNP